MIDFEGDYIDRLNRQYSKGKFLKAAILTESISPLVKRYWVDHEDPIVFQGNIYTPLKMFWEGIKTSVGMPTDGSTVAISNIGNITVKYLKTMDPSGMPVNLQLLHLDLLNTLTRPFERYFKIRSVKADANVAVFTLGRELGKNRLPRRIILAEESQ